MGDPYVEIRFKNASGDSQTLWLHSEKFYTFENFLGGKIDVQGGSSGLESCSLYPRAYAPTPEKNQALFNMYFFVLLHGNSKTDPDGDVWAKVDRLEKFLSGDPSGISVRVKPVDYEAELCAVPNFLRAPAAPKAKA